MFKTEIEFFKKNQHSLVQEYGEGNVLVICGEHVDGVFASNLKAHEYIKKKGYSHGTFIIQPCIEGPEAYTVSVAGNQLVAIT